MEKTIAGGGHHQKGRILMLQIYACVPATMLNWLVVGCDASCLIELAIPKLNGWLPQVLKPDLGQ
jgi:hypothetical protein